MLYALLKDFVKHFVHRGKTQARSQFVLNDDFTNATSGIRKVLNVGGNSKEIPLPPRFAGWQHILLDIDPSVKPDIVCDARALTNLAAGQFEAVYCSHNLEHYYRHDVVRVLAGFCHVLADDGFVHIRVPDMAAVMKRVVDEGIDMDDLLYVSEAGPIHVYDVIYGFAAEIERSGNDFFAHKTGFTEKSLVTRLKESGFSHIYTWFDVLEVNALAFKNEPPDYALDLFGIKK